MIEWIGHRPFLIAIVAGACAQFLKVASFLLVEKKVNIRRFVQADGMPNMHSAAFSALTVSVGLKDGFSSLTFGLVACVTAIIMVDTMNVKNATSRQAEAVLLLIDRIRGREAPTPGRKQVSYTPIDVVSGLVLGIGVALLFS